MSKSSALESRRFGMERDLERKMRDPVAALYGFVVQAFQTPRFDPRIAVNEKAQEVFRRLVADAEMTDLVRHLKEYYASIMLPDGWLSDLRSFLSPKNADGPIRLNREEIKVLRRGLQLLPREQLVGQMEARAAA